MNYSKCPVGPGLCIRIFSRYVLAAFALLFFLCAGTAFSQTETAAVVGTVTDATGGVVPGATVTVTNLGTNINRTATTGSDGNYAFDLLQVGRYSVTVTAMGFKTFSASNLTLSAGDRARLDAKMAVGAIAQTVEVSASAAPALQTDTSNISSLVTSQAVEDVPLNGRNVFKLIQLAPGVTIGAQNDLSSGNRPNDRRQTSDITVNGQTTNVNNNMIDGLDNNDRLLGNVLLRPSVDAIQEVNIQLNKYDASVGRTAGAVVNVITKSGSNTFHGSGFEFFRNAVLNTNPNYQFPGSYTGCPGACVLHLTSLQKRPPFRQNQYGGSLGGPIKKNKTFFFADYEGFSQGIGTPVLGTVPTTCMRGTKMVAAQAAAEGISAPAVDCSQGNNTVLADPGNFSELTPISLPGGSSGSGLPKTGAVIPLANQNAFAQALFSLYPLPTATGLTNNFSDSPLRIQNSRLFDFKFDHHFSDKDSFTARYSWNWVNTDQPMTFARLTDVKKVDPYWTGSDLNVIPGGFNSAAPTISKQSIQNFAFTYVHVFRPSLLLDLRAAFIRSNAQSVPWNIGTNVTTALGQSCTAANCINYGDPGASGFAAFNPTGYTGLGDTPQNPEIFIDNDFQEMASLTWNRGAHSMRFGVALIRRQAGLYFPLAPAGSFSFTGIYSGVPLGDFLEGLGATGSRQNLLVHQNFRIWEPSGYVQDDWRTTRWLTLNLGIRYDIFTPYTERNGKMSNWDPASGLIVSPSIPGIQQSGPTALIKTPYTDIAPRFGFAATLPHNTVIRGGFGLSMYPQAGAYENGTGSGGTSVSTFQNAPFNFAFSCTTQNGQGSNVPCTGPLNNGAVANYGANNATSSVGQTGGISIQNGLPVPALNINTAIPPSVCTFDTNADYSTSGKGSNGLIDPATCPNNPYTSGIPIAYWPSATDGVVEQFNLQVQKQFGENVISVGYVGELGRHLAVQYLPNHISNNTQNGVAPLANQYPWLARTTITANYAPWGTSAYHSLQATFVRRFSKGLTVQANYTWAHLITNSNAICTPTISNSMLGFGNMPPYTNPCFYDDPRNTSDAFVVTDMNGGFFGNGNSGLGVPNRASGTVNYELPFGKSLTGVAGQIVKGWSANAAVAWQTGDPFTITTAVSPTGNTAGSGRPDQTCSGQNVPKSLESWGINPACFTLATTNRFGNEHVNQFYGPNHSTVDFSLLKNFKVTEKIQAQFRTEVFNLFNTPNFGAPSVVAAPAFGSGANLNVSGQTADLQNPNNPSSLKLGAITSLNTNYNSRQIQFAVKILF